ncbi:hypothetical protein B7P43_G15871 [Cryptotermes secundus]|uniref:Uncharacterized protein n=1 Tax=Cryptotermes secundus TaxID=105785 RepID=A0A2J7R6S7_9NEOP|nr:hypothetical protein B7P43_G15871 [Cryptotermes secundus]
MEMELTASPMKTKLERAKTFDMFVSQGDDSEYIGEVFVREGRFPSGTHIHTHTSLVTRHEGDSHFPPYNNTHYKCCNVTQR